MPKNKKKEKFAVAISELYQHIQSNKSVDRLSYVCSALSFVTKGTKYENDAKELIEIALPEFYDK